MRAYRALVDAMVAHGVTTIFGLMGDGNMDLIVAAHEAGIRVVHGRHEQQVVAMADGYARATGHVGVACVTHGPGVSQTGTSLIVAAATGARVLVLAGDTAQWDPLHIQNTDQEAFVRGAGAVSVRPTVASRLVPAFREAWRTLITVGGPVVCHLPLDVQHAPVDDCEVAPLPSTSARSTADPADIDRAAALLAAAERPMILAGRGARDVARPLAGLAERLGAPVGVTLRAKGLLGDHALSAGVMGGIGHPLAHERLRAADVVVAAGASVNRWTTRNGSLTAGAQLIHIDRDAAAIGRHAPVDVALVGESAPTLAALDARLTDAGVCRRDAAAREAAAIRRWVPAAVPCGTRDAIDPRYALRCLDGALGADRVVVVDGGHFNVFASTELHAADPDAHVWAAELGTVGQGLGMAVGAAVGRPDRRVTLVCGDGGFLMSPTELDCAVRERLPITVFVMNDRAYGQEVHVLRAKGKASDLARFATPDLGAIGRAYGTDGAQLRDPADLSQLGGLLARDRPSVIDVYVDPEVVNATIAGYVDTLSAHGMLTEFAP